MDFLPGFAWPVPRAFSSAVAACRFEQGDVLYDHPIAYSVVENAAGASSVEGAAAAPDWGSVVSGLGHYLQVLEPSRSARRVPADSVGRRFLSNWEAPVRLEKSDCRRGRTEAVESTQGRLFTCLWRGDPAWLDPDEAGRESPPPPALARDLHRELQRRLQHDLQQTLPALRRAAAGRGSLEGALIFAFVVDESGEASLAKERAIVSALRSRHRTLAIDLAPSEIGLPEAHRFHPALRVRACLIEAADEQAVRRLLKSTLYGPTHEPSPPSGSEDEPLETDGQPDRFRLERHGLLLEASAAG